jgi:hypothetical protein
LGLQVLISQYNLNLFQPRTPPEFYGAFFLGIIGLPLLSLLLFLHLRGLAKRAGSAHLAEHCLIVGIGSAATVMYVFAAAEILEHGQRWGLDEYWDARSKVSLALALILRVAACFFTLWSLYLLIRFAIAFARVAREIRGKWKRDDRSLETG